jgi:hypothetical protein
VLVFKFLIIRSRVFGEKPLIDKNILNANDRPALTAAALCRVKNNEQLPHIKERAHICGSLFLIP